LSNNLTRSTKNHFDTFALSRQGKTTVEESHTRQTFLIENELLSRFNHISQLADRGFKTYFINQILREALENIEYNMQDNCHLKEVHHER
jgi:hypothetical protein